MDREKHREDDHQRENGDATVLHCGAEHGTTVQHASTIPCIASPLPQLSQVQLISCHLRLPTSVESAEWQPGDGPAQPFPARP